MAPARATCASAAHFGLTIDHDRLSDQPVHTPEKYRQYVGHTWAAGLRSWTTRAGRGFAARNPGRSRMPQDRGPQGAGERSWFDCDRRSGRNFLANAMNASLSYRRFQKARRSSSLSKRHRCTS